MEINSPAVEWFGSPFFHLLNAHKAAKEVNGFIDQLVQHLHPAPGGRVLDSDCGLGENSRRLASLGFQVTGVDSSSSVIDQAQTAGKDNPEYYFHDIRLPFWGNYFEFAIHLSGRIGYYRTRREMDNAFRTIASSLQPGGLLVCDYPNLHYAAKNLPPEESVQIGDTHYTFLHSQSDTHFLEKIIITDPSLTQPATFFLQRARLTAGDFTDMLGFQGMQVQEVFGDYQLTPYHPDETPRLIVVAKKGSGV